MAEWIPLTADQAEQALGYLVCASLVLLIFTGLADWLWPIKTSRFRDNSDGRIGK